MLRTLYGWKVDQSSHKSLGLECFLAHKPNVGLYFHFQNWGMDATKIKPVKIADKKKASGESQWITKILIMQHSSVHQLTENWRCAQKSRNTSHKVKIVTEKRHNCVVNVFDSHRWSLFFSCLWQCPTPVCVWTWRHIQNVVKKSAVILLKMNKVWC